MRSSCVSACLVLACLACESAAVNAGPNAYIGLYIDEYHSDCDINIPATYMQFTTWVWILPGDDGMMCAEFKLQGPAWLLNIGTVENPGKSVILGTPYGPDGASFCFTQCQTDWVWLYQLSQLAVSAGIPDFIFIQPHPDAGAYQVASCEPGYPIRPLTVLSHLALNQSCG